MEGGGVGWRQGRARRKGRVGACGGFSVVVEEQGKVFNRVSCKQQLGIITMYRWTHLYHNLMHKRGSDFCKWVVVMCVK